MPPDLVEHLADVVALAIKTATAPLVARLSTLEQRVSALPTPRDGKDGAPGQPGQDADMVLVKTLQADVATLQGSVESLVTAAVEQAIAALPAPRDGKDGAPGPPGKDADAAFVKALVQADLAELQRASDLSAVVKAELEQAIAALPAPRDGASVTVEDVRPLIAAEVTKAIGAVPVPRDGVGVTDAVIDRDGRLILTLSDGRTKDVGIVVGRDVDMPGVIEVITKTLEAWPKPKDGKDGLGFDEIEGVYDEHGRLTLRFVHGDREKSIRVHGHVYRGVFQPGETYQKGDTATFGGSTFIAQRDGQLRKPEDGDDWRLAVKRGRDGRNGRDAVGAVKLG